MHISVVIPCKNEVGTVETLLDSIVTQTVKPNEVIVVDSNSEDDLSNSVKQYETSLNIRSVPARKRGVAEARNTGGYEATEPNILFVDADAILPPSFFENLNKELNKKKFEVAGFNQKMSRGTRSIQIGNKIMNAYQKTMSYTIWPIAISMIFSTKYAFETLEGFDPEIYIMEDYDYALRARRNKLSFGIITTTYFDASPRRMTDSSSIWRGMYGELYRYTHKLRITKPIYEYKMGGTKKKN